MHAVFYLSVQMSEGYTPKCYMLLLTFLVFEQQGSRLRAEYEVSWDRDEFFRNSRGRETENHIQKRSNQMQDNNERPSIHSRISYSRYDSSHPKRFKVVIPSSIKQ